LVETAPRQSVDGVVVAELEMVYVAESHVRPVIVTVVSFWLLTQPVYE
jgi:hypothetical protein